MASGYEQLSSMVAEIGVLIEDTSTERKTAIKSALNRAYDGVARSNIWPHLLKTDELGYRDDAGTITSLVSGESEIPLPFGCGRIESLTFQDTPGYQITLVEPSELYGRASASFASRGLPVYGAIVDTTAQHKRLGTAAVLTASSSSAANNASASVRVYWRKSTGDYTGHNLFSDLTGAFSTGVAMALPAAVGYPVKMVALPAAWVGSFNLTDGIANIVAIQSLEVPVTNVNSTQQIVARPLLRVWPTPDANYKLTLTWWAEVVRLTEDEDVPMLPVAPFLVERTAAEMLRQMGQDNKASAHEQEAQMYLRSLLGQLSPDRLRVSAPAGGNFIGSTGGRHRWR